MRRNWKQMYGHFTAFNEIIGESKGKLTWQMTIQKATGEI